MKHLHAKLLASALTAAMALGCVPVSAEEASYPMTVTDQLGREITIESKPESIVSGYYISTSLLVSLGLKDQIVGIEAKADSRPIYSLAAPELLELPNVGTAKEFNLEGCAALEPDLVVVPMRLKDQIAAMEEMGLIVFAVNPEDETLFLEAADLLGTITGTEERAQELTAFYEEQIAEVSSALEGCETPSVYLGGNNAFLSTAGSGMYQNSLIERSGAVNAAAEIEDTNWADVSYEQVAAWNPDVIFLAADASYTVEDVLNDEALAGITAIENEAVYQIPDAFEAWDSPVPGGILGSLWGASTLHPDLYPAETFLETVTEFYETFYDFTPDVSVLES